MIQNVKDRFGPIHILLNNAAGRSPNFFAPFTEFPLDDWKKVKSAALKKKDNLLYLVGKTKSELGASEYFRMRNIKEGLLPKVDKQSSKSIFLAVSELINQDLAVSCHDLSEGGLAVTIAEMCMGADMGANIFLGEVSKIEDILDYEIMFSESPTRFMLEVEKSKQQEFENKLKGLDFGLVGCVSEDKRLIIAGKDKELVNLEIYQLRESWLGTFEEFR